MTTLKLPKVNGSDTILTEPVSASSREQMNCIAAFMTQLLPGIKLRTYGRQSLEQIQLDNGFDPDNQACIYLGVIVISDILRDADVLIREFLRPFVETLLHKQSGLYHRLLEEAKIAFPSSYQQIQDRYNNYSDTVQDKEAFTYSLTRYFREDSGKGKRLSIFRGTQGQSNGPEVAVISNGHIVIKKFDRAFLGSTEFLKAIGTEDKGK